MDDRLRSLIEQVAKKEGFTQCNIETDVGSAKGDNYLGTITKVKVSEPSSDKSLDLIMKTASSNADFRKVVPINDAFSRESYFYTDVLSTYNTLLKEYNLEPLNAFPELLTSDMEIPEVLIMADMKARGYVMRNRTEFLDLNHVELVMKEYGKFHGLFYALKELRPEESQKLYEAMPENFFSKMDFDSPAASKSVDSSNEKVMKALLPEDVKARERFEEYTKDTMKKIIKTLEPTAAGKYAVINHGDSWVNNMLFLYDKTGSVQSQPPSQVCLLDFQLSRIASPALDLSYFIFTCTDKKLREKHFDDMLKLYHNAMRDLLKGFSLDVDDFLTLPELHQQMRLFSLFGIHMTIGVTHLMLSDQEEIPDFQNMKINDDDLEETMKAFVYVSKNESRYMERIRGVILDAVERDYL